MYYTLLHIYMWPHRMATVKLGQRIKNKGIVLNKDLTEQGIM
jgi:hypothetical protein